MGKNKRKRSNDEEGEEKEEKVILNKDTSVYLKCRSFLVMDDEQVKEFVEGKGFDVVVVNKSRKKEYCLVDVGSKEKVVEVVKALQGQDLKGSVVVANVFETERPTQKKTLPEITLLDRLLVVKGVSKMVSKKVLRDVFKKVETIHLCSTRGDALREALLLFERAEGAKKAVQEFQGWELAGRKIHLETVTSVPIGSDVSPDAIKSAANDATEDAVEADIGKPANSKSHKQQRNIEAKNKRKKGNIKKNKNNVVKEENSTEEQPPKKKINKVKA